MVHRSRIVFVATTFAPDACISVRIGSGNCGVVTMTASRPARAAYAAAAAPPFPDDAAVTTPHPSSTADETPADAIRSLNDHVGLRDSSFTYSEDNPI